VESGLIAESAGELPSLAGVRTLYLDLETTSGDDKEDGVSFWRGDTQVCGVAVTADDWEDAWYAPVRHHGPGAERWNLDPEPVMRWAGEGVKRCVEWVNANVKFDAHGMAKEGHIFDCRLVDLVNLAKTINSDRYEFGLKSLCREWVGVPMRAEDRIKSHLKGLKSKDYGRVPADLLGDYACEDVRGARALHKWLVAHRPTEMADLWETETLLTPVLWDVEQEGARIDETRTKIEQVLTMRRILALGDEIRELTGVELVKSPQAMHDLFCVQLGLPVVGWTDEGNPSFDKEAMRLYEGLPQVVTDPIASRVVQAVRDWSVENTYLSLFLRPFLAKRDAGGKLHSTYNQTIKTGRTSSSDPNSQQFNSRAKALVIPDPGRSLLSVDASQVEFRLLVHLCKDRAAIAAYQADPRTDFHQWVAELCGISRRAAKNVNFAMAYGAGKAKVTAMLAGDRRIMEDIGATVEAEIQAGVTLPSARPWRYRTLCEERAAQIYATYHERLSSIRRTSFTASDACRLNGYVRNPYKRRRHLPQHLAHRAFNSAVQGGAMDLIKERIVALAPRYNSWSRSIDLRIHASVHDELVPSLPSEALKCAEGQEPEVVAEIERILSAPSVPMRVPFVWDSGWSDESWAAAAHHADERKKARQIFGGLGVPGAQRAKVAQ